VSTAEGEYPSLWVMLDYQDILNRMTSTRYNQFLFIKNPHPMVLWITVLHNREYGARWLPCYLDLGTESGRKVAHILGQMGIYQILFFALNSPEQCKHVMSSTLAANQCKILKNWANEAKNFKNTGQADKSRKRLREELEKIKPKILAKLENSYSDDQTYVS
jgi:serine/threonine-protein kinase